MLYFQSLILCQTIIFLRGICRFFNHNLIKREIKCSLYIMFGNKSDNFLQKKVLRRAKSAKENYGPAKNTDTPNTPSECDLTSQTRNTIAHSDYLRAKNWSATGLTKYRHQSNNKPLHSQIHLQYYKRKTASACSKTHKKSHSNGMINEENQHKLVKQNQLFHKFPQLQAEYMKKCRQFQYEEAASVLIKILNYTIDLELVDLFKKTLKQIAEFYQATNRLNYALFYFQQARLCAFFLNDVEIIIESVIGCSLCCRKRELLSEALIFLKKGLEICWFHHKPNLQLRIYDEIGKVYYLMGHIHKANEFHHKYLNSIAQQENSLKRNLSRQRMQKIYQTNSIKEHNQISFSLLANLFIPILSSKDLPLLKGNTSTLRTQFDINLIYFRQLCPFEKLLQKVMKLDFYEMQIEQTTNICSARKVNRKKKKNFEFLDMKMKQHLKELGIGTNLKIDLKPKHLNYKEPLEEKVRKKMRQPGLDPRWHEKMVKQIKRDRENKLLAINNQVMIRGKNKFARPQDQSIRNIFLCLYR